MSRPKNILALIYRLCFLLLCGYGILRHLSLQDETNNAYMFSYFTVQSNLLCFFVFLPLLWSNLKELSGKPADYSKALIMFKGIAILSITITCIAFHFILRQGKDFFSLSFFSSLSVNNQIVHYLVPLLVLIDWLFFQEKGVYQWRDPLYWCIYPLTYFLTIMLRGYLNPNTTFSQTNGPYPYFFMDFSSLGLFKFSAYSLLLLSLFLCFGYLFVYLDHRFKKRNYAK